MRALKKRRSIRLVIYSLINFSLCLSGADHLERRGGGRVLVLNLSFTLSLSLSLLQISENDEEEEGF